MKEIILIINAGSSSIKFSLFHIESLDLIYHGKVEDSAHSSHFLIYNDKHKLIFKQKIQKLKESSYQLGIQTIFDWTEKHPERYIIKNVGHRIVHGGQDFKKPVVLDTTIIKKLKTLIPLAPLHQPYNIEAIQMVFNHYPSIIQVGCFDTAFHSTQNPLAAQFALPRKLVESGIVRYGFHGLSYEYIASVLPKKIGKIANQKVIVAHLGNGASLCALYKRKSVATSMGFTALDGLMMGTRCGALDPGVILYLLEQTKLTSQEITHLLYNESGLLGVSGVSNDMRELLASNTIQAQEAIDLFCYRAARELSALIPLLKGCDAIVFTAGIGENASLIRKKIAGWLGWLGVRLEDTLNNQNSGIISHSNSQVLVAIIPTNEEWMIAKHTKILSSSKQ